MSQQDLQTVLLRSRSEPDFATEIFRDLPGTLSKYGYTLTADEQQQLRRPSGTPQPGGASPQANAATQTWQVGVPAFTQPNNAQIPGNPQDSKLRDCVQDAVLSTIKHASETYRRITLMNQVLFWMGVSLFLFAVVYAVFTHNLVFTIAFAGLGTASFIGVFILGPIGKTQAALSNLISAEIAFLSYLEQVWMIERFALLPSNTLSQFPDPERITRASDLLQTRSSEISDLLHRYLDKAFELQKTELKHRVKEKEQELRKMAGAGA